MVMSLVWQVFEPLLFGLVGAEVSVEYMNSKVVGVLRFPLFSFNLEIKHEQCYCYVIVTETAVSLQGVPKVHSSNFMRYSF